MHREGVFNIIFNSTIIRPVKFYLGGFYNISHVKYYYIFLCFVYIMTVLGNGFLLSVIYLVKTLHTPRYIIVFNLALTDLCGSTALIPKLLDTFLFERRYIVYEACLSYMFFVLFFGGMQSWTLVTMSYDRLIAICFPLRYNVFVTRKSIVMILLFSWICMLMVIAVLVGLLERLSFCGSIVIPSFFCDHGPTYRLACNDISINYIMANVTFSVVVSVPLVLIGATYLCISIALSRIASGEERLKAMRTCTSHLILVGLFFIPYLGTNIVVKTTGINPNVRILNSSLSHTVPSLLNPIIYALKTEEVINALKTLCKRKKNNRAVSKW
ncbi:olfactory receptor 1-like [Girardinichthys multiradiatus]|uniref:olfactory receptor 1-like n=1 Tax=Girardinichthys multiradiatus TaxID=208333 RepID=UPI001FADBCAE|nr:olfactory receptor 1-like [Girardinichthys multiradiatus]